VNAMIYVAAYLIAIAVIIAFMRGSKQGDE